MFPGFPPDAIKFLRDLKRNNDRDWFQPRKEIFDTKLKEPMFALIEAVNADLLKLAPEHVNDPKKAFYRIYRDTRFSHDKTPYKTHVAAIFPPRGAEKHSAAGFYFQLSDKGIGIAAGSYGPGPEQLAAIRKWIGANEAEFRKTAKTPEKTMGPLQGDSLKRVPKGFASDHPAEDLLRMKQWFYWTELDVDLATSPKLQAEIVKRFRGALPMVALLNRAIGPALVAPVEPKGPKRGR